MNQIVVAALYQFAELPDFKALRTPLFNKCVEYDVKGTILLATEGINGTVAGSRQDVDSLLAYIKSDARLANLEHKESYCEKQPFYRTKVKLKKEIVTLGVPGINPSKMAGKYVEAKAWNELIADPEVLVVDTRNDYEVDIGTFQNAINPRTTNFREFPEFVKSQLADAKDKKIAMFCTGGIRCEKSTAYLLQQGFKDVFHLKGGILKYLEEVPAEQSLWQGECFVFDNRVAVTHSLEQGNFDQCHGCRHPLSVTDRNSEKYQAGVHCPHCYDSLTADQLARFSERHKQVQLAKQRNQQHIGTKALQHEQ
jgi:UPF0176 protein